MLWRSWNLYIQLILISLEDWLFIVFDDLAGYSNFYELEIISEKI